MNKLESNNVGRFPDGFMLELTRVEIRNISQIVICLSSAP